MVHSNLALTKAPVLFELGKSERLVVCQRDKAVGRY